MKKIKVVLINPPAKKIIEPYYDLPDFPRTALAFLAGYIREFSEAVIVDVIDAKFDKLSFEDVERILFEGEYDVVGLTAMTNEVTAASKVAKFVKRKMNDTLTVIGGVHITALPEETLREFPEFDYGILGEGEDTILAFLENLQKNDPTKALKGLCYLDDETFKTWGGSTPVLDQDRIMPAWDMFRPAKEYMIQSSRGCPFACHFCMNPGGRKVRARSVKTTIAEIKWLVEKMKPESIYFGDEIFTVNRSRAYEICDELIKTKLHQKITWWCQTHVNTLDESLAKIMKEASCKTVGLGIETGDDEIFKGMGKGINRDKVKKTIKMLKKVGLNFDSMFILGQPNETIKSAKKTIDFAVELNPTIPIFGLMVPYPGTKVGSMALRGEGGYRLLSKDWDSFNKQIGNSLELKGITRKELERIQMLGYLKVFLYNLRFWDLLKFVLEYKREGLSLLRKILLSK